MINRYIHFYNHDRIQTKMGVAPLTLRHSPEIDCFLHGVFLYDPHKLLLFHFISVPV
jgi:hypothetical protein